MPQSFKIDFEMEEDGRWIAEAVDLPGVLAYGTTREEALAKVETLAHEVLKSLAVHGF
jgi:predicted RNase H-like HicB family nuclease